MSIQHVCMNCLHFDRSNRFCRVNPPIPVVDNHSTRSRWPIIARPDNDFCSKFLPLTKSQEQCEQVLPGSELIRG